MTTHMPFSLDPSSGCTGVAAKSQTTNVDVGMVALTPLRRWGTVTIMANDGMSASEVLRVVEVLRGVGCRFWVGGGWGVDALAGCRTRAHRDLDLALDSVDESAAIEALAGSGYGIETDLRPVRVELAASRERWVDVHPVLFGPDGDGTQADVDGGSFLYPKECFVTGVIAGQLVPCLSLEQQLRFHIGYEPRDIDVADIRLLHALRARA